VAYATNTSGTWITAIIDDSAGGLGHTAIAIDSGGSIHISYDGYNNTTGLHVLKYATNASGTWAITVMDTEWNAGYANSIAVDSSNHVHIAYSGGDPYDYSNTRVNYATNASGTWTSNYIGGFKTTVNQVSIALDAAGTVHIASATGSGICAIAYSNNAGGVWSGNLVNASANCSASLALDSVGQPHIGYTTTFDLMHATNASGAWVSFVADHLDYYWNTDVSIAVGPGDSVHLSYQHPNEYLKYATNASGAWSTQFLDIGGVGLGNSLKVDSNGKAHIIYYDMTNAGLTGIGSLKYATTR
jgi:hypothetical protein